MLLVELHGKRVSHLASSKRITAVRGRWCFSRNGKVFSGKKLTTHTCPSSSDCRSQDISWSSQKSLLSCLPRKKKQKKVFYLHKLFSSQRKSIRRARMLRGFAASNAFCGSADAKRSRRDDKNVNEIWFRGN